MAGGVAALGPDEFFTLSMRRDGNGPSGPFELNYRNLLRMLSMRLLCGAAPNAPAVSANAFCGHSRHSYHCSQCQRGTV